jgi:hypothetical protein
VISPRCEREFYLPYGGRLCRCTRNAGHEANCWDLYQQVIWWGGELEEWHQGEVPYEDCSGVTEEAFASVLGYSLESEYKILNEMSWYLPDWREQL